MNTTTLTEIQTAGRHAAATDRSIDQIERQRQRRAALRDRHVQGLTSLMTERDDLRGAHALADFIDDAVRWTA